VLWGAAVFSLDRFLLSVQISDGSRPSLRQLIVAVVPRVVIAGSLGVLMAEPLVLAVFSPEITAEIVSEHATLIEAELAELVTAHDAELTKLDSQIQAIKQDDPEVLAAQGGLVKAEQELADTLQTLAELETRLTAEIGGIGGGVASGQAGDGPIADQLRAEIEIAKAGVDAAEARRATWRTALESAHAQSSQATDTELLDGLLAERASTVADFRAAEGALRASEPPAGLSMRMESLERLAGESDAVALIVWLVRIWLIAFDLAPIVGKATLALRKAQPYAAWVHAHEVAGVAAAHEHVASHQKQDDQPTELAGQSRTSRYAAAISDYVAQHPDASDVEVARQVGCSARTISRWRSRNLDAA